MATTHYRGSREDARKLIAEVARALAGKGRDPGGVVKPIQLRIGVTALSKVQQDFLVLSRGGIGAAGYSWKPLTQRTIADRRPAPRKKMGERPRGLLTAKEDARWRKIYAGMVAMLRARGEPEPVVLSVAAQIAWKKLKDEGAQTKLEVYGHRQVDILRDTGRLFRSLTPGIEDRPSNQPEQIFQTPPGAVIIGSNVPYAERQHKYRPLWPDVLPESWWAAINASAIRGILKAVEILMSSGARP